MKKSILFLFVPVAMSILTGLFFLSDFTQSERDHYEQFILQKASAITEATEEQQNEMKEPDEPDMAAFQEFISTKEQLIKKAKSRFKNRVPVKSEAEIKHLRPHVTEAVKVLNDFFQLATGDQKKMIDKYCWCQLWWAAKEDAQRQWNEPDVTGMRDEW